jgi:hypothetical protein
LRSDGGPSGSPTATKCWSGCLAAGELLNEQQTRVDLNSLLVSVLKEEARALRGKVTLEPGNPPAVIARPWPIRTVLRGLLLQALGQGRPGHGQLGRKPVEGVDPHHAVPADRRRQPRVRPLPPDHARAGRSAGAARSTVTLTLPAAD